ncbi:MAG: SprT-like domain-containing protein [Bdellovibrionales bacterium]|nr:SprT-like domain-containing protein [Oligoflexia bacterium]
MASRIDLVRMFSEWNLKEFGGELRVPEIRWNSRLKTSAGRFIPDPEGVIIEIAAYLEGQDEGESIIRDTLGHEMIHYWLWQNQKPYGHTAEFREKMEAIGVSRYNTVPQHRPFKHCYTCKSCDQKIFVRKRLQAAACADCCNRFAKGKYHVEYKLRLLASGDNVLPLVAAEKRVG